MLFVLMPAAKELPDDVHTALRGRIMKRWKMLLHTAILLFLISGFYNYLFLTAPLHKGDKLYHPLIGIKILLALVVFFLAIALTGRSNWSEAFRKDGKKWLTINVILATIIVGISGILKNRPATSSPPAAASPVPAPEFGEPASPDEIPSANSPK